jgi:hypothetical protein
MAFVLVTVGILMIVTGAKGTYAAFGSQVASDFTGSQPFTYWLAAIGGIGALGYVDALRTFSRLFMSLILVAMVLANKGFFAQFTAALKQGPVAPVGGTGSPATSTSQNASPATSTSQNASQGASIIGSLTNWVTGSNSNTPSGQAASSISSGITNFLINPTGGTSQ